jgi:hypothetical protein
MERMARAFEAVKEAVQNSPDPALTPEVKQKVTKTVDEEKEKMGPTPLQSDKWIYRCVVFFLGLAILGSLICTFLLSVWSTVPDLKIPDIFLAIGSAAVGALAGLLAPSPGHGTNE